MIGGTVLGVYPVFDWISDLFVEKKDYRGKHVIITGGGTGLGQALAVQFASFGANVTIISRDFKHLQETKELAADVVSGHVKYGTELPDCLINRPTPSENRSEVLCLPCDVTDFEALQKVIKEAVNHFGSPDLVITCAGLAWPRYITEASLEEYEKMMNLNYFGTVKTVKATLPYMLEKKSGQYLIVSSAFALMGSIGYSGYCASKYAVRGFAESLRMELKPHNISVQQFFPTNMDTPSYKEENKIKPIEAKKIDESAATVTAENASSVCLSGFLRGEMLIDNAYIEIGTIRNMASGVMPRNNPFREFLFLPIGFTVSAIVEEVFDETVAEARKECGKQPGQI